MSRVGSRGRLGYGRSDNHHWKDDRQCLIGTDPSGGTRAEQGPDPSLPSTATARTEAPFVGEAPPVRSRRGAPSSRSVYLPAFWLSPRSSGSECSDDGQERGTAEGVLLPKDSQQHSQVQVQGMRHPRHRWVGWCGPIDCCRSGRALCRSLSSETDPNSRGRRVTTRVDQARDGTRPIRDA